MVNLSNFHSQLILTYNCEFIWALEISQTCFIQLPLLKFKLITLEFNTVYNQQAKYLKVETNRLLDILTKSNDI